MHLPTTKSRTNDQLEHQRPTRAVTTNWAESSEVSCVPPLMVGPLQRNALHAHCTPLSPSICDKQNYNLLSLFPMHQAEKSIIC